MQPEAVFPWLTAVSLTAVMEKQLTVFFLKTTINDRLAQSSPNC